MSDKMSDNVTVTENTAVDTQASEAEAVDKIASTKFSSQHDFVFCIKSSKSFNTKFIAIPIFRIQKLQHV